MDKFLPLNVDKFRSDIELEDSTYVDWHSLNSIAFGSLLDDGWDWGRNEWTTYSMSAEALDKIRNRINTKIEDRFFFRDIGVTPVGKFKKMLHRKINDAMAQYGPVYEQILNGLDLTDLGGETTDQRVIESDYPQSQLQPASQDYASAAEDTGKILSSKRGSLDAILLYNKEFIEPDLAVLKLIEPCFSNLLSSNF